MSTLSNIPNPEYCAEYGMHFSCPVCRHSKSCHLHASFLNEIRSEICINSEVFHVYKTFSPTFEVIFGFLQRPEGEEMYSLLMSDGEWKFMGEVPEDLQAMEDAISEAISAW